jgi:hypothetical protein
MITASPQWGARMPDSQIEANKAIIRRYYEFLNGGDPSIKQESSWAFPQRANTHLSLA